MGKLGYTYDELRVGMSFRSPGRTITDADLVGFSGLTGDYSEMHTSSAGGSRKACSGSRTRTA